MIDRLKCCTLKQIRLVMVIVFVLSLLSLVATKIAAQFGRPLTKNITTRETTVITKEEYKKKFCDEFDRKLRENIASAEDYIGKGQCLETLEGRTKEAQSYYRKALPYFIEQVEQRPGVPTYLALALIYSYAGQYHEAIHEIQRGVSLDRESPISRHYLAKLLEQAQEYEDALQEYRWVLRWVEKNGEGAMYKQAHTTDKLTRDGLQKAIQRLEGLIKGRGMKPSEMIGTNINIETLTASDVQYARYCQKIQHAIQKTPRDAKQQASWAYCQIHSGHSAHAEKAFMTALEENASHPYYFFFLAKHYQDEGKHQQAISELRRILSWDNYNPVIQYLLAEAYREYGKHEEAQKIYQKVLDYVGRGEKVGTASSQDPIVADSFTGLQNVSYFRKGLTPQWIRSRLAYPNEQSIRENKQTSRLVSSDMAAIIHGVVTTDQDKPVSNVEVILMSEHLDYWDYQFIQDPTFSFVHVPPGNYMVYAVDILKWEPEPRSYRYTATVRSMAKENIEVKNNNATHEIRLHLESSSEEAIINKLRRDALRKQ